MQQWQITNDQARCKDGAGLGIFRVGADVADMRISQGDDLPGIGRVGKDFLITGHGSIEYYLSDGVAVGSDGDAFEQRAVSQG
ncbi:hypothetical protein D3C85_1426760 [compost metagenome]